ncbi:MAG TPA: erythromycin esterase family protein [Puia sp.]|nr:erythromycin esterase family protein [Puia sp.]
MKKYLLIGTIATQTLFYYQGCLAQTIDSAKIEIITDWLRNKAIPLHSVHSDSSLADLLPLKEVLKDVAIVGLGEATHGTREFFQFKHKMLEFLVKHLGFQYFTLESSYAACQNINDYVLNGKGNLAISLASQGYSPWDTREMTDMIEWMRAFNLTVSRTKRVQFVGVDINYNAIGRAKVMSYFKKYAPPLAKLSDSIFKVLDQQDEKWPFVDTKDSVLFKAVSVLQYIEDQMAKQKDFLVKSSSEEQFDQHLKLLKEAKYGAQTNSQWNTDGNLRDKFMADNLEAIRDGLPKNSKIIFWAHNDHIRFDINGRTGYYLKQKYGNAYYAVGFTFYEGSYLGRDSVAQNTFGPRLVLKAASGQPGTLGWYLHATGFKQLFLDLRFANGNPVVDDWLSRPIQTQNRRWVHRIWDSGFEEDILKSSYDGLFFTTESHPSRPTATIVKMNRL